MNTKIYIVTCAARKLSLEDTYDRLVRAWPGVSLSAVDRGEGENPQDRQVSNWRAALQKVRDGQEDCALIVEDDVRPARTLGRHLPGWILEQEARHPGKVWLGSLYNPNVVTRPLDDRTSLGEIKTLYGSQAYVVPRATAAYCLDHWLDVPGLQDIKITRLVEQAGGAVYYHRPSLIEHEAGVPSTWTTANRFHTSVDFDPWFGLVLSPQLWEKVPGWYDWHPWMKARVRELNHGDCYVEVGCYLGRSLIALAQEIVAQKKDVDVFGVDPWDASILPPEERGSFDGGGFFEQFQHYLTRAGVNRVVTPVRERSLSAARMVAAGTCAVVFIDGDHTEAAVAADLNAWWPKVKPGGFLAGHDINSAPGVGRAVRAWSAAMQVPVQTINEQNIWVAQKAVGC